MLTNYNGTTINYDTIGNPLNWRNATNLTWEARELTSLMLSNDDVLSFAYNSSGIRTQKRVFDNVCSTYKTYDYLLDGNTILSETVYDELTGSGYTLYYLYDASGSIQGFIHNNAYYYFQKNSQGDVVRILNSNGNIVTEYTYDAWGNILSVTGSLASTIGQYNPFRYRGYYYDRETGYYYLQSRYYDPVVGRFLNADGIIGANGGILGNNMFAYCSNNPIMGYDPTGMRDLESEITRNAYKQGDFERPDPRKAYSDEYSKGVYVKVISRIIAEGNANCIWGQYLDYYCELIGEYDNVNSLSLGTTAHLGFVSVQLATVVDSDELDFQITVSVNTAPSVGISLNGAASSADDTKDWLGGSLTSSKELVAVNTQKIDVALSQTQE